MKFYFEDKKLYELYTMRVGRYPNEVIVSFIDKIDFIKGMRDERDLGVIKSHHFEKLKGYENLYSIRLNKKYRMEFSINKEYEIKIINIKRISNHYL